MSNISNGKSLSASNPFREAFRLLLLDTQPLVRSAVRASLAHLSPTVLEVNTPSAAMSALAAHRPHLVICEISLNGPSGLDFIKGATKLLPQLRILVFSGCGEELYAPRAIRAGARAFVSKNEDPSVLSRGVEAVLGGKTFVSQSVSEIIVSQLGAKLASNSVDLLSDRELEVFTHLGEALGTAEIARKLRVSKSTVESYRAGIKRKLGLKNAAELLRAAVECAGLGTKCMSSPLPPPTFPSTQTLPRSHIPSRLL